MALVLLLLLWWLASGLARLLLLLPRLIIISLLMYCCALLLNVDSSVTLRQPNSWRSSHRYLHSYASNWRYACPTLALTISFSSNLPYFLNKNKHTLSSFACNRFSFRCSTKTSYFIILIISLPFPFPFLLPLFYSFRLSLTPIIFFLQLLNFVFQVV